MGFFWQRKVKRKGGSYSSKSSVEEDQKVDQTDISKN